MQWEPSGASGLASSDKRAFALAASLDKQTFALAASLDKRAFALALFRATQNIIASQSKNVG